MISQDENKLLTDILPGSGAGAALRRYWQPAALAEEVPAARPIVPVTLMGERLVLFRDESGRYGLVERQCPHRGADLSFGRPEDGGLRCAFHGWLFDVRGQCLEQPAEPAGSRSYEHVKHRAYPCREANGIVFAYLGPDAPPPLENLDCFAAPDQYTFAFKGLMECNWLQAVEVGIDPAHASFLHRFLEDEPPQTAYGKQFRGEVDDDGVPLTRVLREHPRPQIAVHTTRYGLRLITTRTIDATRQHYRVTNLLFPNAIVIPMSREMTITQWHVPIDNHSCYWYAIFTSFGAPVDKTLMRNQRLALYELPSYRPRINKDNLYGFDAEDQKTRTFTGMGADVNVHDQWAVESMGTIQDRTREHLGKSDVAIIQFRKMLKSAIIGKMTATSDQSVPVAVDLIGKGDDAGCWLEFDRQRRSQARWGAGAG